MNELNFKKTSLSLKNSDIATLRKSSTLVFCAMVLLICSIFVRFVGNIAKGMKSLFFSYSNLNNSIPIEKNLEKNLNENLVENIELTGISFDSVEITNPFQPIYLVAGGDVMLSRNIGFFAKRDGYDRIFKEGNYNPLSEFKNCESDNCLLFLNLESLFCEPDHDIQMGGFDFRANPQNIETLLQYRQDKPLLLALPNNHFANGGFQGLTITKDLLKENQIFSVGAGFSEKESREIFSRENNGIKICLGAYSYDGKSAKIRGGVVWRNDINEEKIKSDLQKMEEMKCDAKIVSLHRGAEYRFSPNNWQKNLAHSLIDSGVDLILGGHSHIPGEFEVYNGKYVFYSLGNFIFDQGRGKRATGSEFNYFYDEDLRRNAVPTYISMLVGLKFQKNLMGGVDIDLEQIEFSSTTDGIFGKIGDGTRNNLLEKINHTDIGF